jgi:hypothetical protein
MQHERRSPVRNKIELTDPTQRRAWTKRFRAPVGSLEAVIGKVGNSVTAVAKEIESQRSGTFGEASKDL